jgi:sugar lactone lactonase YvrE
MTRPTPVVFDARGCQLGEGPLWHPELETLFWVDILANKLLYKSAQGSGEWVFAQMPSAIGWVDADNLLVAAGLELLRLRLDTGQTLPIARLPGDDQRYRSNDGRADPQGGFWISKMAKEAQDSDGVIYRYYEGELRELVSGISIPNGICFSPDGKTGYYADTLRHSLYKLDLDAEGWPKAAPQLFISDEDESFLPDGAITDALGNLWVAIWGRSELCCYAPDGRLVETLHCPVKQPTCPATSADGAMYLTSAAVGLEPSGPLDGQTFSLNAGLPLNYEPAVKLTLPDDIR